MGVSVCLCVCVPVCTCVYASLNMCACVCACMHPYLYVSKCLLQLCLRTHSIHTCMRVYVVCERKSMCLCKGSWRSVCLDGHVHNCGIYVYQLWYICILHMCICIHAYEYIYIHIAWTANIHNCGMYVYDINVYAYIHINIYIYIYTYIQVKTHIQSRRQA